MNIHRIKPSGYCYGVVNAINIVLNAIKSDVPKPITIYGMLIHNKHVIESFKNLGVNSIIDPKLSDLDELEGTIIFTAHGIREHIKEYAASKGLHVIDATCKDVTKTIDLIKNYINDGYEVLYIGKKGHPEATAATEPKEVTLITSIEDISINRDKKYVITNQTTMSVLDVKDIYDYISTNYNNVEVMDEVCNATRRRQEAVLNHFDKDLLIVVGDKRSNNSNNLAKLHPNGILVETYRDLLDIELNYENIAVTAGASTPKPLVDEVVHYLNAVANNEDYSSDVDYKKIVKLK